MNPINKIDVLPRLTEEMREVLRIQEEMSKDAFSTVGLTTEEIRDNYTKERAFWNEGGPAMETTRDVMVPFEGREVKTRLHCPNKNALNACIFYIHGGGMVVGNVDTHDRIMRLLAHHSGSAVVGIDYSLSPEAKFPTALHECVAVCRYFRQNAAEYGVDPSKIGFAGDSGGAHLSFMAALMLRDQEEDTSYIRALLLYYGYYGMQDGCTFRLYGGALDGLTEEDLAYYKDMYITPEEEKSPYYIAYNNDLCYRIPPCFIAPAEFDPLLDDSRALYTILTDKGQPCEYKEYKGTIHAFLHYSKVMKAAEDALKDGAEYFKKQL